jgi:hypothetical protein
MRHVLFEKYYLFHNRFGAAIVILMAGEMRNRFLPAENLEGTLGCGYDRIGPDLRARGLIHP